jgi:hypothetical protein
VEGTTTSSGIINQMLSMAFFALSRLRNSVSVLNVTRTLEIQRDFLGL